MSTTYGARRGRRVDLGGLVERNEIPGEERESAALETFDLFYRSLCAALYNYVPGSGHPGGSISSGRIVQALVFESLDLDLGRPDAAENDVLSYAAGHKALGLYALWALRDEVARLGAPELLPEALVDRLRLEDLLGFRRNPTRLGPLAREHSSKALDGHPTPATPFVRLSTGASGVGVASSFGLALAAREHFGAQAPRVHVLEGEGGLTPGRVHEALSAASTAGLSNLFLHVDWNQASIDTDRVCGEQGQPGDYVPWSPAELLELHGWNVVEVDDGFDWRKVLAAQRFALGLESELPTAIVYRTRKGWRYGIEGRASHGAGHKLCSAPFYEALAPLTDRYGLALPGCEEKEQRCGAGEHAEVLEQCFYEALVAMRGALAREQEVVTKLAARLEDSRSRLAAHSRAPRPGASDVGRVFEEAERGVKGEEPGPTIEVGGKVALRAALGQSLSLLNRASGGALLAAAADLLGSTSVNLTGESFPEGYYHAQRNPEARLLSIGGICEDAMAGMLSGLAAFGAHLPVGSSYAAFIAPLGHIAARLHGIGSQALRERIPEAPYRPMVLACAHAGLKTGEDGPTHADPQALQLLAENFPPGVSVTLTPWEPQEVWPLLSAALVARPALIAPFVTRPAEPVLDRRALGLAPASAAVEGVYELLALPEGEEAEATVVLQGSEVTYAFVQEALPTLRERGHRVRAFYVASAELFDALPAKRREEVFPEALAQGAMGITGFTWPTMRRFVRSGLGETFSLHPFARRGYPGSGHGASVLEQAGLDGAGQVAAIESFIEARRG